MVEEFKVSKTIRYLLNQLAGVVMFILLESLVLLAWNHITALASLSADQLLLGIVFISVLSFIGTLVILHFLDKRILKNAPAKATEIPKSKVSSEANIKQSQSLKPEMEIIEMNAATSKEMSLIEIKEKIYKPLRQDVEKLIERVRVLSLPEDVMSSDQPSMFWKELEGKVSPSSYGKLEDIFATKLKEYYGWLRTTKNLIRYQIYFYVNQQPQLDQLQKEYQNDLGAGSLEYHLYSSLVIPIIHGDNIDPAWFKEHDADLWENIEKCPHSTYILTLLDWLKKEPNSCIETLRRNQSDLTKLAANLKDELNQKIRQDG